MTRVDNRTRAFVGACLIASALVGAATAQPATAHAESSEYRWEREEVEDGIALDITEFEEHDYDVVRATAEIDAPIDRLLVILHQFGRYPAWFYRCRQALLLGGSVPTTSAQLELDANGGVRSLVASVPKTLMLVLDLPHVADRWAILRTHERLGPRRSLQVRFRSIEPAGYTGPPDAVRMKVEGGFTFVPLTAQRTRVTLMINVDPHVSLPAFLVDSHLHEIAVETLRGLRRVATKHPPPHPREPLPPHRAPR